MIWIDSKHLSKVFNHSRWKLNWQSIMFELFGVNFSLIINVILDLNYKTKLFNIENTLGKWRRRTPIGRLTIIKTLIITKMNHLILTLPKPSWLYFKKILRNRNIPV